MSLYLNTGRILRLWLAIFLTVLAQNALATFLQPDFDVDLSVFPRLSEHYIQPNEWFDGLYEAEVKDLSGAMISTGTIRAFQKILYGNFEWAIIVDIDPVVAKFNELNYQAITQSKSLRQYLENFPDHYFTKYGVMPKGVDLAMVDISEEFIKNHPLYQYMVKELGESIPLLSGKDDPQFAKYFKPFFFSSEAQFQKMRLKLETTKILHIVGSFTDPKLAVKIQKQLDSQKTSLSLIDISNIMDYILPTKFTKENRDQYTIGLRKFLEKLKFASGAKAIFTTSFGEEVPILKTKLNFSEASENEDTFRYYSARPRALIDILYTSKMPKADDIQLLTLKDFSGKKRKLKMCKSFYL